MATKTSRARAKTQAGETGETLPSISPLPAAFAAAIVFVAAGSVLVLEILSVRLLAPYVGLTLETTTSIIGAVLLGISVGAGLGGWIADRTSPRHLVVVLLIGGGLLALLTVPIVRWLGSTARAGGNAGALKVTFVALVPVAAVLSAISPTVAHWQLRDLRASGTIVGGLSAWAAAGALVGTFGTGFVLVPLLPVTTSVLAVGVALVLTGILLGVYALGLNTTKIAGAVLSTAALGALGPALHSPCDAETSYHCVRVEVEPGHEAGRFLLLDEPYNSYVDLENPLDLGSFHYTRWIADQIAAIGSPTTPLRGVFVGGGGFTLPRWLEATRPGSRCTVLEVDGQLIDVDRAHLGLQTSPQLRATAGDARLTMEDEPTGAADFVVGDAFSSRTVPWQLMTTKWLNKQEKLEIAHQLARLGVDVIEAGFPITSPGDFESVRAIAREVHGPVICGLARTSKQDIDAAWNAVRDSERPRIHTFIATSDIHIERKLQTTREDVKGQVRAAVSHAREY